jgi:hypothetical protein
MRHDRDDDRNDIGDRQTPTSCSNSTKTSSCSLQHHNYRHSHQQSHCFNICPFFLCTTHWFFDHLRRRYPNCHCLEHYSAGWHPRLSGYHVQTEQAPYKNQGRLHARDSFWHGRWLRDLDRDGFYYFRCFNDMMFRIEVIILLEY